ncbi:TetR/AcrR family transcriptional regulator [Dyadobacter subterraneus]|uniref:TetR/AcrR family transcriptional regulator n=1 Tax=Dyadobacter subterraneus TaxID=2773304 RepID=A0ABR9WDV9_9BACT|nr:TetR/AcrR family transcriptional regulator [Dyadobacter subterraneus]MBE9463615.1 TetR/AcrR family transcriptional regulator [Dyadobacter subterraneus]
MRTRDTNKQDLVKKMAIETIVKYGLEGFTIAKLARACNISVGTPYVYYQDKDDLIIQIVLEEGAKMEAAMNKNFDPDSSLEDGLRVQWKNRVDYMIENPLTGRFFDQISSSTYHEQLLEKFHGNSEWLNEFRENIERFITNAVDRNELDPMPFEVYWTIAFAPLNALVRFHLQGRSITGKSFQMSDDVLWETFDRVLMALKK